MNGYSGNQLNMIPNENGSHVNRHNRNEILDSVKGIAIFLVVSGHLLPEGADLAGALITVCHMPVFFFVSGFFFQNSFEKHNGMTFLAKKVKTLLIPYLCWSTVSLLVNSLPYLQNGDWGSMCIEFVDVFIYARSVWFLIVLFMMNTLYFCIQKCTAGYTACRTAVSIAVWVLLLYAIFRIGEGKSEILHFYKLGWLFPYFFCGNICSKYKEIGTVLQRFSKGWYLLLTAFIYGITVAGYYDGEAFAEFYGGYHCVPGHIGYYILFYVTGAGGILLVCMAAVVCKAVRQLAVWVGAYSLDIYVMHSFFVRLFQKLFALCQMPDGFWYGIAVFVSAAVIAVLLAFLSEKILHKFQLYRISIGGR